MTSPTDTADAVADAAAARADDVDATGEPLERRHVAILCASIAVVAACGIVYELLIATVGTYLIGDGVRRFSFTVGGFMAAMGLGAWASRLVTGRLVVAFITVEIVLALVGGVSSALLFAAFPTGLHGPVSWILILTIGTLVGLEIPLIVRLLSEHGGVRRGVASALSFDYVGAVVGSVAFPLFLLPQLGLFRAAFAIGLLNAAVAVVTALAFRGREAAANRLLIAGTAAGLLLVGGMFAADAVTRFAEDRLFADRVILREQTPYQRIVLTRQEQTGEHRLYINGHVQFAEFDEYRYHEALVLPAMGLAGPGPNGARRTAARVLILGGGDGLAARDVLAHPGVTAVTIVDLDPAITKLARDVPAVRRLNRGSLDDPRVTVVNDDAFRFVRELAPELPAWDRVIVDLPDPHDAGLSKLYSVEFYRLVARILAPGGAVVTQSGSPYWTPEAFWSVHASLAAAGYEVTPYHVTVPAFGPWGFNLGRLAPAEPLAVDLAPWARFLDGESFAAARVFPRDVSRAAAGAAPVNSIFEPVLHELYRVGVQRGRPAPRAAADDVPAPGGPGTDPR